MEEVFQIGDLVKSNSGHDKNRLFLVVSIDKTGKIGIIDGRYREKTNPKKKNPKHLIKVAHNDELVDKYNSKLVTNAEIYKAIKVYQDKE